MNPVDVEAPAEEVVGGESADVGFPAADAAPEEEAPALRGEALQVAEEALRIGEAGLGIPASLLGAAPIRLLEVRPSVEFGEARVVVALNQAAQGLAGAAGEAAIWVADPGGMTVKAVGPLRSRLPATGDEAQMLTGPALRLCWEPPGGLWGASKEGERGVGDLLHDLVSPKELMGGAKLSLMVPKPPLRCLAMISSAVPLLSLSSL